MRACIVCVMCASYSSLATSAASSALARGSPVFSSNMRSVFLPVLEIFSYTVGSKSGLVTTVAVLPGRSTSKDSTSVLFCL